MCESHVSDCVRADWAGKAMCVESDVSDCVRGDWAGKAMCVSQT